mgnify:CR=1 FL=1
MIIIAFEQSSLSYLFQNADKASYQILIRIGVYHNKIKQRAECGTHDGGIIIRKLLQQDKQYNDACAQQIKKQKESILVTI